jgi:hypothetical protein
MKTRKKLAHIIRINHARQEIIEIKNLDVVWLEQQRSIAEAADESFFILREYERTVEA